MPYALAKKPEEQVKVFGFELERQPGAWSGRRTIFVEGEGGKKESVVETASAWAKADGSGLFVMITRWNREGERKWTVDLNFTMEGKFIEAKSKEINVDGSEWRTPGRESNEVLQRQMQKLMENPLMKEDMEKAITEGKRRPAKVQEFVRLAPQDAEELVMVSDLQEKVEKPMPPMSKKDKELLNWLRRQVDFAKPGTEDYDEFIAQAAKFVKSVFGFPEKLDEVREEVRRTFGKEQSILAVDVYLYFRGIYQKHEK